MKKLLLIICLGLFISPTFLLAQADCFMDQPGDLDISIPLITASLNCALNEVGIDCPVETGSSVTITFGPQQSNASICEFWCTNPLPNQPEPGPPFESAAEQLNIFNRILAFAELNAPICEENGMPMVLTNIAVGHDVGSQAFLFADLTFSCCVLPQDCNADFDLVWDPIACEYNATNLSTASTFVDCGDCQNPSGITSVSWTAKSVFRFGPSQSSTNLGSGDGFNFSFDLNDAGEFSFIQVCLTIEDCNGCQSSICKKIFGFPVCAEFIGEDDEEANNKSRVIIESKTQIANVYPNPTSNTIYVELIDEKFDAENAVVELYDLQGKLIKSIENVSEGLNTFDLSDLISNVYFLSVVVNGEIVQTEKVILNK